MADRQDPLFWGRAGNCDSSNVSLSTDASRSRLLLVNGLAVSDVALHVHDGRDVVLPQGAIDELTGPIARVERIVADIASSIGLVEQEHVHPPFAGIRGHVGLDGGTVGVQRRSGASIGTSTSRNETSPPDAVFEELEVVPCQTANEAALRVGDVGVDLDITDLGAERGRLRLGAARRRLSRHGGNRREHHDHPRPMRERSSFFSLQPRV